MTSAKVKWARKEIGKRLRKAKTASERKHVFKDVWSDAARKFD
jgi:hypothetical protein